MQAAVNKKTQNKKWLLIPVASLIASATITQTAMAQNNYDNSVSYFTDAQRAGDSGDINALYTYEQMMSGSLFAMYPTYWRLNNDINSLHPNAVINFVQQYPNTVMAEKLVADYAESKASTGDYATVRQVSSYITNADKSENCAIALGNLHGGDSMQLSLAKQEVWLNTHKQPALCEQFATELTHSHVVNQQDKKDRLYRMLRKGKTGDILALSSSLGNTIGYSQLSEIQLNPTGFMSRMAYEPYSDVNQYLYLYAIGRLTDKSYREAAMQLDYDIRQDNARSQHLLSDETRQHAYRTIAVKRMNMNTDDGFSQEAVDWFRKSSNVSFNYEEAEDYAQAAIRYSEWDDLNIAITQMSPEQQQQPKWQYWLARAYENSSDNSHHHLANNIYDALASTNDYYGFLSQDKVGKHLSSNSNTHISNSDRFRVMDNPSFARAFALYDAKADRRYANREWNWGVKQALNNGDKSMVLSAAKIANEKGWLDRSIYAMEQVGGATQDMKLSHPMPHQNSVVRYSNNANIDPAWAYGIMRQESRFNVGARSGVGASGLMQIMPSTGKFVARKLGEPYSKSRVNNGDTNIRYGTWYMGYIMGELNYQPTVATAGYNAGPNKAKRWLPVYNSLPADQYVETIAYPETRNYVKRVMENSTIYGTLLGQPKPISKRMGTVWSQ